MHTYLKMSEDRYEIGQWLINQKGYHHFSRLFSVPNLKQAFAAVNMLNGGSRISPDVLHLKEE